MVPDRPGCMKVLEREGVPEHIIVHSALVADVALKIAVELNSRGEKLDLALLEAGALLHDLMKLHTINHGGNHALLGGDRVARLGFPELTPLVAGHVDLGEWDASGPVTETELVNYADKRVCHTRIVSLGERFEDLIARYGKTSGAVEKITQNQHTLSSLEKKIFKVLGLEPEKLDIG